MFRSKNNSNSKNNQSKGTDDNVQVEVSLGANNLFNIHVTEDKKLQSVVKVPQQKRGLFSKQQKKKTKHSRRNESKQPARGRSRTTGAAARVSSSCPPSLNRQEDENKAVQVIRDLSCPPSRDQIESLEASSNNLSASSRRGSTRKPNLVAKMASRRHSFRRSHKLIPAL